MSECRYLKGENIAPRCAATAKLLEGKTVSYVTSRDIDKSGRGYFFPKTDVVKSALGRQIVWDDGNSTYFKDILEMVEVKP